MNGKHIAIVGAGTAGLIFAHRMLRMGNRVTLFSDRTPEQWLHHSPPTGSAFAYGISADIERAAGLDDHFHDARPGDGILFDFVPAAGAERVTLAGKFCNKGAAVDLRLRIHDWMHLFQVRGGNLVIESMDLQRLTDISHEFDDIFIAAGKGDIGQLFGRNSDRPFYAKPQRKLAMMITENIIDWQQRSHVNNPVKFNFFADAGEMFYVPYFHKSGRECYNILFEAKEGSYMDVFDKSMSDEELNNAAREWLLQYAPWDSSNVEHMHCIIGDDHSTLVGAVPPHVRNDFGTLPNGRHVYPLGDSWATFDPIGGQGFNNGARQVDFIADRYTELGRQSASPDWAREYYGQFWNNHGQWATLFNNLLLEPLSLTGMTTLLYAVNNDRFCDEIIFGQFHAPKWVYKAFDDADYASEKWRKYAPSLNSQLHIPEWVPEPVAEPLRRLQLQATAA
ncbi:MAG: styrene monooxygenase/indole monooxygenase family protein [Halioglobus sp.]